MWLPVSTASMANTTRQRPGKTRRPPRTRRASVCDSCVRVLYVVSAFRRTRNRRSLIRCAFVIRRPRIKLAAGAIQLQGFRVDGVLAVTRIPPLDRDFVAGVDHAALPAVF